ncbi:hypothetical protein M8C21_009728, partial [Ambrosia artemisiifolia]
MTSYLQKELKEKRYKKCNIKGTSNSKLFHPDNLLGEASVAVDRCVKLMGYVAKVMFFYNKPMNSWSLKCLSNNLWREMFLGMIESGNTIGVISDG